MTISIQIAKWGNSLGLRLPKAVALEASLGEGDTVEVSVRDGEIVIRAARPTYSLLELVDQSYPGEPTWRDGLRRTFRALAVVVLPYVSPRQ